MTSSSIRSRLMLWAPAALLLALAARWARRAYKKAAGRSLEAAPEDQPESLPSEKQPVEPAASVLPAEPVMPALREDLTQGAAPARSIEIVPAVSDSGLKLPGVSGGEEDSVDAKPNSQAKSYSAVKEEGSGKRQKTEGAIAKGFFNKPRKPVPRGEVSKTTAAADIGRPQTRTQESDSLEPGEAALKAAHDTISKEQAAGTQAFGQHEYQEAKEAFVRMRDAARGAGLQREEGQAHRLLANALDKLDAPDAEVEDAFKKALALAHKQDDMELSFNVLTGMGSHAVKSGDLEVAEHFYLQSRALANRVLTSKEEADAEGNLGMCLCQCEARRAEAFQHFRKAISLQKAMPETNLVSVATLQANLASALTAHGKHKEAESEYQKALTAARSLGNMCLEESILRNLADMYDGELGNTEKARECRMRLELLNK